MPLSSFNTLAENQVIDLSPVAQFRNGGELFNAAKSAVRALDVIEVLGKSGRPMRAVEITRALHLSASSADQLLKTMVDAAYLIFDPRTKHYAPSYRAARLGRTVADAYFPPERIDALMDRLHGETGELVGLFTSQGSFMQVIETHGSPWPMANPAIRTEETALGLRLPMFGSTSGAAWLASQDAETVDTAIRLCRRELGEQASDPQLIQAMIRRVRQQGYAYGGLFEGILSLSAALPPCPNGVVLVLSIFGAHAAIEPRHEQLGEILVRCVAEGFPA